MSHRPRSSFLIVGLLLILFAIAASTTLHLMDGPAAVEPTPVAGEQYLPMSNEAPPGFRFSDVPPWLFLHVAAIASLQVIAVIAAAVKAGARRLERRDHRLIQFLCEIPMYLGLFGTLLGVCMTQFITGTLVAPLAYITTMSGIVLHIAAKLFVLLSLPDHSYPGED